MSLATPETRWHDEVDIGIIGAGGCGLAAALAADHPDLRVAVWERAKIAGGNTALTDGAIPAAGTRLQREAGLADTAEDFARDVFEHNGDRSDPALTRRLCASSAELIEWLSDRVNLVFELEHYILRTGHRQHRMHVVAGHTGSALVEHLVSRLGRQSNAALRLGAPVLELWHDADGAVLGLQVRLPKKSPTNVRCRTVILACDGFGANDELVKQHCPGIAGAAYAGVAGQKGDALRWGAEVQAACEHLDAFHAHPTVAVGSNYVLPSTLIGLGAVIVNQQGKRFADEAGDLAAVAERVRAQPGRLAYEVFDARILKIAQQHDPRFEREIVPRTLRRGADIGSLANQFQLDPAALAATIADYNATVGRIAGTFGRLIAGEPMVPPFYGARVTGALLATQGGLKIDTAARVLRADGTPVPNLYAGGGSAVGLSGPGGPGYLPGMGLLCALGWGKIAGEEAVRAVLTARAAGASAPPAAES